MEDKKIINVKADSVKITPHSNGLLVTCHYGDVEVFQMTITKGQALNMARELLNVLYKTGFKEVED